MDWLTFISKFIETLVWPVVVLSAIILLRRPLIKLLPSLKSAKYKDFELQFGEKLIELEDRAEQARLPKPNERPAWVYESPDDWTFGDYIHRLSPISPRAAISEAWRHVELAMQDSAKQRGRPAPKHLMGMIKMLESEGRLPKDAVALIHDLRVLRNQAVHARDIDLEADQAIEFGRLAERLIASIKIAEAESAGDIVSDATQPKHSEEK